MKNIRIAAELIRKEFFRVPKESGYNQRQVYDIAHHTRPRHIAVLYTF